MRIVPEKVGHFGLEKAFIAKMARNWNARSSHRQGRLASSDGSLTVYSMVVADKTCSMMRPMMCTSISKVVGGLSHRPNLRNSTRDAGLLGLGDC